MVEQKTKVRFPAADARKAADELVGLLGHYCTKIEIAGSLRRGRADVGDIEILYIPAVENRPSGLFGGETTPFSLADYQIDQMLASGVLGKRANVKGSFAWGEKNKLGIHLPSLIPVDLFATTDENWWVSLVVRTGSAETNLKLTTGAQRRGGSLIAYGGGVRGPDGNVTPATSEKHVFDLCGVPYLEPKFR